MGPHAVRHVANPRYESQLGLFRRLSWSAVPLTIAIVLYSDPVQRWLNFRPPSFPGNAFVSPALGSVLFLAGGPFLWGAVKEARAGRPARMFFVGLTMTLGVLALVAGISSSSCGC